ncbi:MAG: DNA double-strand break repair nuclease NurA [Candidatus Bathyarchaeia archaeon]
MIEQYTITTTPKYNFPHPAIDTTLPQRFSEISINSLKQVHQNNFMLNLYEDNGAENNPTQIQIKRTPLPLTPKHQQTTIAAVDSSTIKIGETSRGIIIAIRGATVWKQNRSYHYTRIGPFIFHITEENKKSIYSGLERTYFATQNTCNHQVAPPLLQMPNRLANLLERWLQLMIAKTINNGVILFDGSLIGGTTDTPIHLLHEILSIARRNKNVVLAFSKATTLRVNGYLITEYLPEQEAPYLLETTGLRFKPPTVMLGDVYVARLQRSNVAFRLDIDKEIVFGNRIEAVEKLLGNDALQQSYPETLRLAHILCTFTANEVLAMQHFASCRYGVQIINRPDMHRLLFGPFGREGYA